MEVVVQADEDRVPHGAREIELRIADGAGGADHREGGGHPADITGRGVPEQNLDLRAAVPQLLLATSRRTAWPSAVKPTMTTGGASPASQAGG